MPESPVFESPITKSASARSALTDQSATFKTLIRAAPDSTAAGRLGVAFGTSRRVAAALICGSRPGEWLILGERSDDVVPLDAVPLDTGETVSVIDMTHGRALLRLTSDQAPRVLEKVCSLDFSDAMTPDGAVVSASVARVSCDLVRDDEEGSRSYLIACDRSFGDYLFGALLDACEEFGLA